MKQDTDYYKCWCGHKLSRHMIYGDRRYPVVSGARCRVCECDRYMVNFDHMELVLTKIINASLVY